MNFPAVNLLDCSESKCRDTAPIIRMSCVQYCNTDNITITAITTEIDKKIHKTQKYLCTENKNICYYYY